MTPGNTDPWAGPVDPTAVARELARFKSRQNTREALREQEPCGCWANDCAECGPRRADGKRPAKGSVRDAALRSDAMLLDAQTRHAMACRVVTP